MLTDSERAWLEQRDAIQFALDGYRVPGLDGPYEMQPDYEDAALFEARVAAKLAGITESMMQTIQEYDDTYPCWACPANENCAGLECREVLLRYARLTVEEEMDADR